MFPLCSSADMTFVLVCGTVFICQRYHGHTDERALLGPANLSEKHENVKKMQNLLDQTQRQHCLVR